MRAEFRAAVNRNRNPSLASVHQEHPGKEVGFGDSGEDDEMLEQSEDEVRSWRIGLREEETASGTAPNVQDTEHAAKILERSTITRQAEEVVDPVASSSSRSAEGSEERVAELVSDAEKVLKHRKITCSLEKLKVQELPTDEQCGVARAVEPIRAELSSNLSECEGARALEHIHSKSSAQTELKETSDRVRASTRAGPKASVKREQDQV